jgi:hypothetical protein
MLSPPDTLIVGCTGEDALAGLEQGDSLAGKTLASCSSEDIEFQSLLMSNVPAVSHLADREIRVPDGTCLVLRGGFPINFDGARESLPSEQIQPTRGLLLSGVLQAIGCLRDEMAPGTEMLSPELQQLVLRTCRSSIGDGAMSSHPELESTTTIEELSGGSMRAPQCADLLLS